MKTKSILKTALCLAGLSVVALTGAQAQEVQGNFDTSTTLNTDSAGTTPTVQGAGVSIAPGLFGNGVALNGTTSNLQYNVTGAISGTEGTVSFWYQPTVASGGPSYRLLDISNAAGTRVADIYYSGGSPTATFTSFQQLAGDSPVGNSFDSYSAGDWLYLTYEWNTTTDQNELWVGDGTGSTATTGGVQAYTVAGVDTEISVGSYWAGGANAAGVIDDLYISNTNLYAFGSTVTDPTSSLITVPEPSTLALVGLGGLGLAFLIRRRRLMA